MHVVVCVAVIEGTSGEVSVLLSLISPSLLSLFSPLVVICNLFGLKITSPSLNVQRGSANLRLTLSKQTVFPVEASANKCICKVNFSFWFEFIHRSLSFYLWVGCHIMKCLVFSFSQSR